MQVDPRYFCMLLNYQVLLHAGAYINKCDRNGCTPVYKAAFHGRPSLIELLAKAGEVISHMTLLMFYFACWMLIQGFHVFMI